MTMRQILFHVHRSKLVGKYDLYSCSRFVEHEYYSSSYQYLSPCPDNQTRCGAFEGFPGVCTTLCCEESMETCYDDKWEPLKCVAISDGGCPCPDNQVKCEVTEFYPGYCSDVCCDLTIEGEISCVIKLSSMQR